MTTAGSFDAPIEIFGGLVTDMSPADLPHGVSPDCQDVVFSSGGVATRPGLQTLFGSLAGNPTINYLKTYETPNATLRALVLDAAYNREATPGKLLPHGQMYILDFPAQGLRGLVTIRTAWIVERDTDFPRLVTCYAKGKKR